MSGSQTKTEVFTVTEMGDAAAEGGKSNTNNKRRVYEQYVQPCLAELFGTSLFMFVGCASVIGNVGTTLIQPALAHGLVVGVLIKAFGQISGGHFNPVVSVSIYLCGGMKLVLLLPYVLAQMIGSVIGAFLTKAVYPSSLYTSSLGGAFNVVNGDLGKITLSEVMLTLILTTVVCMMAVNSQTRTPWAPFCIGLTVTANIFAG
ncbi:aquaporin-8-like [Mugil cephalus]|uniref:aquaporin-8-like n=1 Tax=Mugil cephalus TaxID=48193 RepID=UPI001FB5F665|nr:aquaporin-8-like [Mugil cephalus]